MTRRKLTGIRAWKGGLQAYIQVNGRTYSKSFPQTTPLEELRAWRQQQKDRFSTIHPERGSFGADIETYLGRVTAIASYKQFAAYLALWATALGKDRPRRTITSEELDHVLQGWLLEGLSASTVRKRRTVLVSLWRTLDGSTAENPARATRLPRPPKPEARAIDYLTIQKILDAMQESQTKRRIAVLAWTGLPPSMLKTITREDLDLDAATVRVRPRRKGAGVEARTLPLLKQGAAAFRAFDRADAYGPFAADAMSRVFKRACARASVSGVTLYDLRHSFGTMLYRVTKDLATVARFMLHATPITTARYAQAAMKDVDRDAADRAAIALERERRLSQRPVLRLKAKTHRHLQRVS